MLKTFSDTTRISLKRVIGEGGMGTVYEADMHGAYGYKKTVAVKILLDKFSQDPIFVRKLVNEAKLMANLVHTNIAQVHKLGSIRGQYFIAMEYINGITLTEFIEKHLEMGLQARLDIALFIISRVCRALDYAHRRLDAEGGALNIVHRDICPSNIMVTIEGGVKLTDFGVSKNEIYKDEEEGEVVVGKISYMSPEQANFEKTSSRSDIYSLGIVMYEMLTGENPFIADFDDRTPHITQMVMRKNIRGAFKRPREVNPDLPEEIERIILKAMEKDLDKRYQSAAEMDFDIERYMYLQHYHITIMSVSAYLKKIFPDIRNRLHCPMTPWDQLDLDKPFADQTSTRLIANDAQPRGGKGKISGGKPGKAPGPHSPVRLNPLC